MPREGDGPGKGARRGIGRGSHGGVGRPWRRARQEREMGLGRERAGEGRAGTDPAGAAGKP